MTPAVKLANALVWASPRRHGVVNSATIDDPRRHFNAPRFGFQTYWRRSFTVKDVSSNWRPHELQKAC